MTIASEITRLQNDKAAICTAIQNKGVTVGNVTLDSYAACIDAIQSGSSDCFIGGILVGGGGGGGTGSSSYGGGGGGAGGVEIFCKVPIKSGCTSLCVCIGGGGTRDNSGKPSYISNTIYKTGYGTDYLYANGGGSGGAGCFDSGSCGGSGGGGGGTGNARCPGCPGKGTAGQGNGGGLTVCASYYYQTGQGGGGGGWCEPGYSNLLCIGCTGQGGRGGTWSEGWSFSFGYGGNGGGTGSTYIQNGGGGCGGGAYCNGCQATACGGGGGGGGCGCCYGGAGSYGIAIIKYPADGSYGFKTATGGTKKCANGWCYHQFYTSGTFTITG